MSNLVEKSGQCDDFIISTPPVCFYACVNIHNAKISTNLHISIRFLLRGRPKYIFDVIEGALMFLMYCFML